MNSRIHLFPHSSLPMPAIKKLISFFGPVRIYQSWFIDPGQGVNEIGLEIFNPPERLKPKEDIKALLSGYRQWARENHGRTQKEILKFQDKSYKEDNATWEIRRLLKGAAQPVPEIKEEEMTLKWHLLLHLASEIERQHLEVEEMMSDLKKKGPVLAGLLQDPDESQGLFDDGPGMTQIDLSDNLNIGWIIEAWFGLFSGYISDNDLLITCNASAFDYLSTKWEEKNTEVAAMRSISIKAPDLSAYDDKDRLESNAKKIRTLMSEIGQDPARFMDDLNILAAEINAAFTGQSTKDPLNITLKYFPFISPEKQPVDDKNILKYISGKTMILAE